MAFSNDKKFSYPDPFWPSGVAQSGMSASGFNASGVLIGSNGVRRTTVVSSGIRLRDKKFYGEIIHQYLNSVTDWVPYKLRNPTGVYNDVVATSGGGGGDGNLPGIDEFIEVSKNRWQTRINDPFAVSGGVPPLGDRFGGTLPTGATPSGMPNDFFEAMRVVREIGPTGTKYSTYIINPDSSGQCIDGLSARGYYSTIAWASGVRDSVQRLYGNRWSWIAPSSNIFQYRDLVKKTSTLDDQPDARVPWSQIPTRGISPSGISHQYIQWLREAPCISGFHKIGKPSGTKTDVIPSGLPRGNGTNYGLQPYDVGYTNIFLDEIFGQHATNGVGLANVNSNLITGAKWVKCEAIRPKYSREFVVNLSSFAVDAAEELPISYYKDVINPEDSYDVSPIGIATTNNYTSVFGGYDGNPLGQDVDGTNPSGFIYVRSCQGAASGGNSEIFRTTATIGVPLFALDPSPNSIPMGVGLPYVKTGDASGVVITDELRIDVDTIQEFEHMPTYSITTSVGNLHPPISGLNTISPNTTSFTYEKYWFIGFKTSNGNEKYAPQYQPPAFDFPDSYAGTFAPDANGFGVTPGLSEDTGTWPHAIRNPTNNTYSITGTLPWNSGIVPYYAYKAVSYAGGLVLNYNQLASVSTVSPFGTGSGSASALPAGIPKKFNQSKISVYPGRDFPNCIGQNLWGVFVGAGVQKFYTGPGTVKGDSYVAVKITPPTVHFELNSSSGVYYKV